MHVKLLSYFVVLVVLLVIPRMLLLSSISFPLVDAMPKHMKTETNNILKTKDFFD